MRDDEASWTARWVAWMRSLGELLPEGEQLVVDPYGARFAWPSAARLGLAAKQNDLLKRALIGFPPLRGNVRSLQIRTRALDDAVGAFRKEGGRQIVILGAGFDARAARLGDGELKFFEVDHPATQAKKRGALPESRGAVYVAWDFESQRLDQLPAALAAVGHDPRSPTLTLWEGVTMYLTPESIDATVEAVRRYSLVGSRLVFNYIDTRSLDGLLGSVRSERLVVAAVGEPFRFGWRHEDLSAWMEARGFRVRDDRSYDELADALFTGAGRRRSHRERRIAIVEAIGETRARP